MQKLLRSPLVNVSLIAICWALQIFVAKLGLRAGASVFSFSLQTLFVILILLSLYVLPQNFSHIKKLPTKTILFLLLIGVLGAGVGGTLSNVGIQLTTATNAGFLFQFDIALTIIFAWIFIREKLNVSKIVTLCFIIFGTFLLTTKGQLIVPYIGDLFVLFASAFFALATVLTRKVLKNTTVHPDIAAFLRTFAGFLFLSLAFIVTPSIRVDVFDVEHSIYVFFNALFCIGTIIFLNRTLKIASASYTALMTAVTPILVAILGILFLKETILPIQFVGAVFIISSSFVTHLLKFDKH